MNDWNLSRRRLLAGITSVPAVLAGTEVLTGRMLGESKPPLKVAIFSKHLQFLEGEALAKTIAEMGYDGVDLTVRKSGHVEPERTREELPKLYRICKDHGLDVPMITTDIVDADTPNTEEILQTMKELNIRYYRWGGFKWKEGALFAKQIEEFKPRVARLAKLNARYGVTAMYHTHSGIGLVGASIWDLHEILRNFDPKAVSINYDVGHATVEGGFGGWIDSFRISGEHLQGVAVKDFLWERNKNGEWNAEWKPLGQGMVRFQQFFQMVREVNFNGPLQLHFEYPLGGAEAGKRNLTMPRTEILAMMKKDLGTLRSFL